MQALAPVLSEAYKHSFFPSTIKSWKKCTIFYCIERYFKKFFTVIIIGELTISPWHLYRKSFVVSLDIDDFTFIAHAQKRQSERFWRPEKCKRNTTTRSDSVRQKYDWERVTVSPRLGGQCDALFSLAVGSPASDKTNRRWIAIPHANTCILP